MSAPSTPGEREQRLEHVLADVLHAEAAGRPFAQSEIVAQHPDLAGELASFFRNRAAVERLAEPLRQQADDNAATIGPDPGANGTHGRVRYFGDYELLEEIARGGMGVVFKARQVSLNRTVALKMILKGELATPADVQRFQAEAEAAANLDHPNIVPIYEVGNHEGQQYFSMKLIDQRPVAEHTTSTQREAAARLAKVARAVHHAHQRGILHRDLKPSNILIDRAGEPHVADFGLAKHLTPPPDTTSAGQATRTGAIVGTPAYMAPEQARAEKALTTAVDVYSLGTVLYEWLTGQPPFRGTDPLATLLQVAQEEPARPSSVAAGVDRDLETICLRCLEKDPARRYPSALAVAEDLERWLRGEPIVARPVGKFERLRKWARRRPALAALVVVTALALIAQVAVLSWRLSSERGLRRQAESAEQAALRTAYYQSVALAHHSWLDKNVGRTQRLLAECPAHLRGWEYHYVDRLCHFESLTVLGGKYSLASYSADGKSLTLLDADGSLLLVDATSGKELRRLGKDLQGPLAASDDGRYVAGCTQDDAVQIWDIVAGQELHKLAGHAGGRSTRLAVSRDGRRLASGGPCLKQYDGEVLSSEVKIWDAESGKLLHTFTLGKWNSVAALAFHPQSGQLAAAETNSDEIKLWDEQTGKVRMLGRHTSEIISAGISGLAFSPDGKTLASASKVSTIKLWDLDSGKQRATLTGHTDSVTQIAFSPDGQRLASMSADRIIRLWDTVAGKETSNLRGHTGPGNTFDGALAFHPNGTRLASSNLSDTDLGGWPRYEVKVWDVTRGQDGTKLDGWVQRYGAAVSRDGRSLAAWARTGGDKHAVKVWELDTGRLVHTHGADLVKLGVCVFHAPDGQLRLVSRDNGTARIWDPVAGKVVADLEGAIDVFLERHTQASPDGRLLVGVGAQQTVQVWDTATGKLLWKHRLGEFIGSLAFAADGKRLVVAAYPLDKNPVGALKGISLEGPSELTILDSANGKIEHAWPVKDVLFDHQSLALSPDGALAAVASGKEVSIVDLSTGATTTLAMPARLVAFSPDGARLATAHAADGMVTLWETTGWKEIFSLRGLASWPALVRFSPDGHYLLTQTSRDGIVTIHDGRPRP